MKNIVFLGLFLLVASIFSNVANASEAVLTPLKSIYQNDLMRDKEPFSDRLAVLYEAAVKRSLEIEAPVSGLDFDYAINGQDFEDGLIDSVVYTIDSEIGDKADVKVQFKNFDSQTLGYSLVKENGKWLIDDVKCLSPNCDWVLSELYKDGAAQAE